VIDVEIHLGHNRERVRKELRALANRLEQHYGKQPILYVTYDTYNTYIKVISKHIEFGSGIFSNHPH